MFAVVTGKQYEEVRSFLIAHEFDKDVIGLCNEYGVEYFEIAPDKWYLCFVLIQ